MRRAVDHIRLNAISDFFKGLQGLKVGGRPWFSERVVDRRFEVGRLSVRYSRRSSRGYMGRFGGGWNWKVGVQVGSTTVILSLLVAEVTFRIKKKEVAA